MAKEEIVYLGRNNKNKITTYQTSGGITAPYTDVASATRAQLYVESIGLFADTDSDSWAINVSSGGGVVVFDLGSYTNKVESAYSNKSLKGSLVVFDASNVDGLTILHQDAHDLSFRFLRPI